MSRDRLADEVESRNRVYRERDELLAALEALTKCAWHHSTCPAHPPGGDDDRCNCGYVDAAAAARDAIARVRGREEDVAAVGDALRGET